MRHFADRLIEQIEKTGTYGCLGIDPRPDWNPATGCEIPFSSVIANMAKGVLPA